MKKYRAGNFLRGFFEGEFPSIDEAWSYLSKRFLISYPSESGRYIIMEVYDINPYGFEEFILCRSDYTEINDLDKDNVLGKCKNSLHTGI